MATNQPSGLHAPMPSASGDVPHPPRARRLLLSIHDVGPRFESEVDRLHDLLGVASSGAPIAMLVVPNHWGEAPLTTGSRFAARLRRWADRGTELFVHGWFHRDTSTHEAGWARWRALHMTAGEGEFLGLGRTEALARMRDGKALVEDISGREAAGFVAPAWLYGEPARAALGEVGFRLAEDHLRVWRPADEAVIAHGPVITWATRTRAREASSLAVAALARWLHPSVRALRVAVHPGDIHSAAVRESIARVVQVVMKGRQGARYAELGTVAAAEG